MDVGLRPTTTVRRRFELLDTVAITTDDQLVVFHVDHRGARAAAVIGTSLLASAHRQETGD